MTELRDAIADALARANGHDSLAAAHEEGEDWFEQDADAIIAMMRGRDDVILDAAPLRSAIRKIEDQESVSLFVDAYGLTAAEFYAWLAALGEETCPTCDGLGVDGYRITPLGLARPKPCLTCGGNSTALGEDA
jgi:hypothetical protein